jgi:hypothetical protein
LLVIGGSQKPVRVKASEPVRRFTLAVTAFDQDEVKQSVSFGDSAKRTYAALFETVSLDLFKLLYRSPVKNGA